MVRFKHIALTLLITATCAGCLGKVRPISQRGIGIISKDGAGPYQMHGREDGQGNRPPEIFLKKPAVVIEPVPVAEQSGSLFHADDARNSLYADPARGAVGSYLDILVDSHRMAEPSQAPAKPSQPSRTPDAAGKDAGLEDTLAKALPNLAPAEQSDVLLKSLKARVVRRLPNGDVVVAMHRSSTNQFTANSINAQARIPGHLLQTSKPISTKELEDVVWLESRDGDYLERRSAGWEDEYTLRMSGFSEAKSKIALDLEDKRMQLEKVKQQLENRLKSFGEERRTVAKERDRLAQEKVATEAKVKDLEQKLEEQKATIDSQQSTIQDLSPAEDKPGDKKEGAGGA